jgi:hypothetical protein
MGQSDWFPGDILNIKLSHKVHRPIFTVLLVRDSVFCFGQFCEVVGLPIIHKEDLAKFDYTLKRMVEKFRNHASDWLHATIYL